MAINGFSIEVDVARAPHMGPTESSAWAMRLAAFMNIDNSKKEEVLLTLPPPPHTTVQCRLQQMAGKDKDKNINYSWESV